MEHAKAESLVGQHSELERILAKLSPQGVPTISQNPDRHSSSTQPAPISDSLSAGGPESIDLYGRDDKSAELLRLKEELLAANSKIALQEQELAQTRVMKHTLDQALGPPSEAEFGGREVTEQTITHLQNAFNASNPGFSQFQDAWNTPDDSQSDASDALSTGAYNRARGVWGQHGQHSFGIGASDANAFDKSYGDLLQGSTPTGLEANRFWGDSSLYPSYATPGPLQPPRVLSGPSTGSYGLYCRSPSEQSRLAQAPIPGPRRAMTLGNRCATFFPAPSTSWGQFGSGSPADPVIKSPTSQIAGSSPYSQSIGIYQAPPYHPRQVATPLCPTATEFTTQTPGNPWLNSPVSIVGAWVVNQRLTFTRPVEVLSRHTSHRTNPSTTDAF